MASSQPHIVIVGGGMVGLSLALLLAGMKCSWRITVLEAFVSTAPEITPRYRPSFDARSSALSQHSHQIFERLGVWQELATHVAAIEAVDVSDRGRIGGTVMTAKEQGLPALGYVVENAWLGAVLNAAVTASDSIELLAPAMADNLQMRRDGVEVTLESGGPSLRADLLVVADGAQSSTRDKLGIEALRRDYGQHALVANVALDRPHNGVAWERFTTSGPVALLPLPDFEHRAAHESRVANGRHRAVLIWTLPPDRARELSVADEAGFIDALHHQLGYRAGQVEQVGERVTYPLQLVTAREQCRRNLVVVGNAAHSLHPVAGQGFNLALRDLDRLARVLGDSPQHPGELSVLQEYVARSRSDQEQTIILSDHLPRLFARNSAPLALARNLGLLSLDGVPPLRRAFARRGMGFNP